MDTHNSSKHLLSAVARLLRPLARVLIARGITFDGFAEAAKRAFMQAAEQDFALAGKRQTGSRISVLTGLSRKEVARLQAEGLTRLAANDRKLNRAAKVVSGWVRQYGRRGDAKMRLPLEGARGSFAALVRRYSGDMPVQAVLDELVRTGTVGKEANGEVRLINRTYLAANDKVDKIVMLGTDVADLIACIGHNLDAKPEQSYFQRKTTYNNLPPTALPRVRAALATDGQRFLEGFDRLLAQHDRDTSAGSESGGGRMRAVVGVYYYQEDFESGLGGADETNA
jgi:hypothetical protein